MNAAEIAAYCLRKQHVTQTYPFGSIPVCFKLNGRIFAQLYPDSDFFRLTLKCTREMGEFYRRVYPEKVRRGYHCPPVQQPYTGTADAGRKCPLTMTRFAGKIIPLAMKERVPRREASREPRKVRGGRRGRGEDGS